MKNVLPFKPLLLASIYFLFAAVPAEAAIIVQLFGPDATGAPQLITPLNTVIGAKTEVEPDYRALTSSNTEFKFVRHISDICYYWFRADGDPTAITNTQEWSDVYWYVGNTGDNPCTFVDGAEDGSNNFVLLHSSTLNAIVGVLQYDLNGWNDLTQPARLIAYAVDPNGMTFADGVAAIQAVPEPSTVALTSLALLGGLLKLRRRN